MVKMKFEILIIIFKTAFPKKNGGHLKELIFLIYLLLINNFCLWAFIISLIMPNIFFFTNLNFRA